MEHGQSKQQVRSPGGADAATGPALACAAARARAFSIDGLELHGLEWPADGPPVLLLHGGAAHAHWFDPVVPALRGRYHLVSLDQRGHGLSGWPSPPAYRTEDFARDIAAVADRLGWERFALAGHSMGGHNAMAFAAWHPERVSQLVIIDSRPAHPPDRLHHLRERGYRPLRRHATAAAALESFRLLPRETIAQPGVLEHLARKGIIERDGAWLYRFDPACNGTRQPVDAWTLLDRISAPTLIIRGELSPILPREMAERMRGLIPRADMVEIAGSYHHVTLDVPDTLAGVLDRFLQQEVDRP